MKRESDESHLDAVAGLTHFLNEICRSNEDGSFVHALAHHEARWATVQELLSVDAREVLDHIAFRSYTGGFSSGNLKAHYVLDEDFINDGTAFVIFSLVGRDWTHVIRVNNQNQFITAERWLEGDEA